MNRGGPPRFFILRRDLMRKFLRYLIVIFAFLLGAFTAFTIWIAWTNYRPSKVLKLDIEGKCVEKATSEPSILTWNTGYAGFGAEMDFLHDGGETVKPVSYTHLTLPTN